MKISGNLVIFILSVLYNVVLVRCLFQSGTQYTYSYNAVSSSGVMLPSKASSSWGLKGNLILQANQDHVVMQLQLLEVAVENGHNQQHNYQMTSDKTISKASIAELAKPFRVSYKNGLVENFTTESEATWAKNIKRSIAGTFQLDLANINDLGAFHSAEVNHYGNCNIEYVVISKDAEEKLIRKSIDPRTCKGYPNRSWSNIPDVHCRNNNQNSIINSSERLYKLTLAGNQMTILNINTTGEIYAQPFQNHGELHYFSAQQSFELKSKESFQTAILMNNEAKVTALSHELHDNDYSHYQGTDQEKEYIFQTIAVFLDELTEFLQTPGLDANIDYLHNTTVSELLYYLNMLSQKDLHTAYNRISGTSYQEETIRNIFLEAIPHVGSKESALFILDLILQKMITDIAAINLLTHLPFHVREPDVELLLSLQPLLNLPHKISTELQNTGILTFGTLIYKTCLRYCPYEMLDDYVRLYLDKVTEAERYEKKMVWLEGLANIQLGRVVEFLEPIASGNSAESRHLRVLAAWASLPTAPFRPDVIYPVYWPILVNKTEHLEMRIAALTLLIASKPAPDKLISLYWYMQGERNEHLYNYFYSSMKSMEGTNFPCFAEIKTATAQITRILRKPKNSKHILTGDYVIDYQDSARNFGSMLRNIIVGNPLTNVPEMLHLTLNNHASGITFNHMFLYVKAEGLLHSLTTYMDSPTHIKDILQKFKLPEQIKNPIHLEIIFGVQQKAVLCVHFNETNIEEGFKYLISLPEIIRNTYQNMEFHVNQQRINVPLILESRIPTDVGTNIRLAVTATSLFSLRGNFTHSFNGRNNHVILRSSFHGSGIMENYNPVLDLWHSAERQQCIHGYLPMNITIGLGERLFLSYNTPKTHLRAGILAHARTITTIRGPKVDQKLALLCQKCSTIYTVKKHPDNKLQNIELLNVDLSDLGGQIRVNTFNCESVIMQSKFISDVLFTHRSNHQIIPVVQFPLLALHFLDYFTYVPPKGSCGWGAYIETVSFDQSEIKLEYTKNLGHHMISLTRRDISSARLMQQWNLVFFYESNGWTSDILKMKASRVIPGEKVVKVCLESERNMPWNWEFLSTKPSEPSQIKLNIIWGLSDSAKGKCIGSSIFLNLVGEISQQQLQESEQDKWPYEDCRKQMDGKNYVPYSDACYETSKELSTLRKYQMYIQYEKLPEGLTRLIQKLQAFYEFIGGNSSSTVGKNQFIVSATFPKDSHVGEMQINKDKVPIQFDPYIADFLLTRTGLHKYADNIFIRTLFSTCELTSNFINSMSNISIPINRTQEVLVLGHCRDDNPRFALTATVTTGGITLTLSDSSGTIKILPKGSGGTVYNHTIPLPVTRSFEFYTVDSKRIRLDNNSVDVVFPNILLYIHWTQKQVLFFFPSYVREFTCGMCTVNHLDSSELYKTNPW